MGNTAGKKGSGKKNKNLKKKKIFLAEDNDQHPYNSNYFFREERDEDEESNDKMYTEEEQFDALGYFSMLPQETLFEIAKIIYNNFTYKEVIQALGSFSCVNKTFLYICRTEYWSMFIEQGVIHPEPIRSLLIGYVNTYNENLSEVKENNNELEKEGIITNLRINWFQVYINEIHDDDIFYFDTVKSSDAFLTSKNKLSVRVNNNYDGNELIHVCRLNKPFWKRKIVLEFEIHKLIYGFTIGLIYESQGLHPDRHGYQIFRDSTFGLYDDDLYADKFKGKIDTITNKKIVNREEPGNQRNNNNNNNNNNNDDDEEEEIKIIALEELNKKVKPSIELNGRVTMKSGDVLILIVDLGDKKMEFHHINTKGEKKYIATLKDIILKPDDPIYLMAQAKVTKNILTDKKSKPFVTLRDQKY